MTVFIESPRFPDAISYGSAGGPTWNTNIVITDSGAEIRNQRWSYPRHEYDVAFGVKDIGDLEDLLKFFHVVAGQAIGFRYKDHLDYKSCDIDGTVNSSDCVISSASNSTAVQLYKTYVQGSYTRSRKILKPVVGSVLVSVNGSALTTAQFTVDSTLGVVNISAGYSTGVVIKAGFEFDVPVRFNTDTLSVNMEDYKVGAAQCPLIELKWADT
jgi:uncharacterized protein (TIGR02217 family)